MKTCSYVRAELRWDHRPYCAAVSEAAAPAEALRPAGPRTLRGLVGYFLRLGSSGFGGPIALVGYMHRDLVEERRWFTEQEFQQGLAVGQMMPGPLAAQTAMWLGYLQSGAWGALAVAAPFVLPPFLFVTAVAVFYTRYEGLDAVHAIFLGVGPAVLAIIAIAAYKLARSTNKTDPILWMATFAGYLVYGITGAIVAAVFVFLPALLLVVIPGPLIRRHENHPRLQGFIKGATAAAAGAIAGAGIVIAGDVIDSVWSIVICVVAFAVLVQPWRRVPEPALVAAAALVGIAAFG